MPAYRVGERDAEGRERRAVYLPPECWDWLEDQAAADRSSRSDLLEGIVLLAMDKAHDERPEGS